MGKSVASLWWRKTREKAHVTNIRNVKGSQHRCYKYLKQKRTYDHLYANKLENLGKTDKFLEKYSTRRKETLSSQISNKELWSVIESLLTKKILGPDGLIDEFSISGTNCIDLIQILKEKTTQ